MSSQHYGWCEAHNRTDPHYCGAACCAVKPEQQPEDLIEVCDACNGRFDTTSDPRIEAECDSQIADHDFEPQEVDPTVCAVDGWMKIEHDLGRNLRVHESCFLDHDDILVRV